MYQFERKQFLPISIDKGWAFFSNPKNLHKITPEYMGLVVTVGNENEKIHPGMIYAYSVKAVLGIPLEWVTEIKYVVEPTYFVDEQRFGPYKFWHHEHQITEVPGGIEVRDLVSYKLYGGPFGRFLNWLFVQKQLDQIFSYREKKLREMFR